MALDEAWQINLWKDNNYYWESYECADNIDDC